MNDKLIENLFAIIAGIGLIIYSLLTLIKLLKYKKVEAECVDVNSDWFFTNDTASKGYKSKYSFYFNGEEIIAGENNYLGNKTKLHNHYIIYVNPDKPTEILSLKQIIAYIMFLVFGIILILVSLI